MSMMQVEKKALEKLQDAHNFGSEHGKTHKKGFFDKMKDMF